MDKYLKVSEGVELRYKKDIVENEKATILINHGFAEHLGRYEHVAEYLNVSGYSVYRYDLRGHGKSKGQRGYISDYNLFTRDAEAMVALIKKENPKAKIFMLGHSMGGMVNLLYALDNPNKLEGQIFSGPAVSKLPSVKGIKGTILNILSIIHPKGYMKNPVNEDICSVDEVVENYKNDDLVLKEATFKFFKEFLIEAPKHISRNIKAYGYPCLIAHGEEDTIVPVGIGGYLYNNISSKDKEFQIYPNLHHEILNETNKYEVLAHMVHWLDERTIGTKEI